MSPSFPARSRHARRGFTLIELLTVIAIIAILMGLLFPAITGAKEAARKAEARSACAGIVTAVKAYQTEYGVYPLNQQQAAGANPQNGVAYDTVYGDKQGKYPSYLLFDILRAIGTNPDDTYNANNALNPRQVTYLEGQYIKDPSNPKSGFNTQPVTYNGTTYKAGTYFDPWGNEYVTFIDATYDNSLNTNSGGLTWFYKDVQVQAGAAACSIGKDHSWGTNGDGKFTGSDDVGSWQ